MVRTSYARQPLSFLSIGKRTLLIGRGSSLTTSSGSHGCRYDFFRGRAGATTLVTLAERPNTPCKRWVSCGGLVGAQGPTVVGLSYRIARSFMDNAGSREDAQVEAEREHSTSQEYPLTTEEVRSLVDVYSAETPVTFQDKPVVSMEPDEHAGKEQGASEDTTLPADKDVHGVVRELKFLLRDEEQSHERLHSVYRKLPFPRAAYLPRLLMDQLLDRFCMVEASSEPIMLRFLSVVDDVKASNRRIQMRHWNSMIRLVAKCFKKISDHEVNAAMDIWRQMEREAGVQPDHFTFNILFDIATKAGKFPLADMLHREMQARGLKYTRYFRTSMIYHCGLRRDTDGVRRGYSALVEADEIVDTAVINSVLAALLLCGEASAAEMTFERMKRLNAVKTNQPLPPSHWRDKRKLGKSLQKEADRRKLLKRQRKANLEGPFSSNLESAQPTNVHVDNNNSGSDPFDSLDEESAAIEDQTSVAPDLTTFKLLIHYHAVVAADIDRVADLIDEMEHYRITVHGSIFLYLFKAFKAHGGILYTQWTVARLRQTWISYLGALDADAGTGNVYISPSICILAARAFLKCAGPYEAAEAWHALKIRISTMSASQMEELEKDIAQYMQDQADHFSQALDYLSRRNSPYQDEIANVQLREDEDEGLMTDDLEGSEVAIARQ